MPTVGTGKNAKQFPYTTKGEQAAKKMAKKTGKTMKVAKKAGRGR